MQSIVTFGGLSVVMTVLGFIPIIGWILLPLAGLLWFVLWIVLMVKAFKGEENAKTKGKHTIPYEDVGENTMDFDEFFYNIQTIIPNLFSKITLNIRRIEADGTLAVWIMSMDEKSKTEINISFTSIQG